MKNIVRINILTLLGMTLVLSSCLITEIIQPERVETEQEFDISISVVDSTSDPNPWRGTLSVMVPTDWEFVSGSYTGSLGQGTIERRGNWVSDQDNVQVSKTDSIRAPDNGMKWIDLISDASYGVANAPVNHTAVIRMKAGVNAGRYNLGYIVSKDAFPYANDLLGFWQDGAADSLFNQSIEVTSILATSSENEITAQPDLISIYPNPSQGQFRAYFGAQLEKDITIKIFDVGGKLISEHVLAASQTRIDYDLRGLSSGRYILIVESGKFSRSELVSIL